MSDQKDEFDEVLSADDLDDLDMLLDELDASEIQSSEPDLPDDPGDKPVENDVDIFDALDELTLDDFIDESDEKKADSTPPHQETDSEVSQQDKVIESVKADEADEGAEQTISHGAVESGQKSESDIADHDTTDASENGNTAISINTSENESDVTTAPVATTLAPKEKADAIESASIAADAATAAADAAAAAADTATVAADAATTAAAAATAAAATATAAADAATAASVIDAEVDAAATATAPVADADDATANNADERTIEALEQESQVVQDTGTSEHHQTPYKDDDDEDALSKLFGDRPSYETSDEEQEELPVRDSLSGMPDEPEVIEIDELTDLPLHEIDVNPDNTMESDTVTLEKDIENLLESNPKPSEEISAPSKDPAEKETNMPNKTQPSETAGSAASKLGINLNMANSITMSLGLIAVLIAALASWFALDASQQIDSLKAEPPKMQQKIDQVQEQLELMQQQVNGLTAVVANKSTENWQKSDTDSSPSADGDTPPALTTPVKAEQQDSPAKDATVTAIKEPLNATKQKSVQVKKSLAAKTTPQQFSSPFEVAVGSVKGWAVNMMSYETAGAAEQEVRRLRAKDVKAEFVQVPLKGKIWFRVRVSGFHTEREAVAYEKYMTEFQAIDVWHHKLK